MRIQGCAEFMNRCWHNGFAHCTTIPNRQRTHTYKFNRRVDSAWQYFFVPGYRSQIIKCKEIPRVLMLFWVTIPTTYQHSHSRSCMFVRESCRKQLAAPRVPSTLNCLSQAHHHTTNILYCCSSRAERGLATMMKTTSYMSMGTSSVVTSYSAGSGSQ